MARNNYSLGILLIVIAVILLLGRLGVFAFLGGLLWPVFVLAPGLFFHFLYFNRSAPSGVLVPGGILVTYSLMFFFCNLFGWGSMAFLWPGFIFGVAVGLYEMSLFDRNARGAFTAAVVLAIISGVFFSFAFLFTVGITFVAFALIAVGLLLILSRRSRPW